MAGENFIALEITSQEIKTGVDTVGNQLGGFTGNTDTVKTELQTLKDSVAQLQTKVDQLLSKGGGLSSCIRHIQRISTEVYKTSGKKISLSGFTDFNKMIAILDSSIRIENFTKSEITLKTNQLITSNSIKAYCQIIEFY